MNDRADARRVPARDAAVRCATAIAPEETAMLMIGTTRGGDPFPSDGPHAHPVEAADR